MERERHTAILHNILRLSALFLACSLRIFAQTTELQICDQQAAYYCLIWTVPATVGADFRVMMPGSKCRGRSDEQRLRHAELDTHHHTPGERGRRPVPTSPNATLCNTFRASRPGFWPFSKGEADGSLYRENSAGKLGP
jgi:hypothetical protein